jgi:hypothetical protein
VVETLCYVQSGRSRVPDVMSQMIFFNLSNPSDRTRPLVYSASNRNEYQKQEDNVSGE